MSANHLAVNDVTRQLLDVASPDVLFHGSNTAGLNELDARRHSTDADTFGRQQAVYATDDPLWAMFFAVIDRSNVRSLRNGSLAASADSAERRYFLSVEAVEVDAPLLTAGTVYVLDRAGFSPQPPRYGLLDTAQWAGPGPMRPRTAVSVQPADFPLADRIRIHHRGEPLRRTLARCRS